MPSSCRGRARRTASRCMAVSGDRQERKVSGLPGRSHRRFLTRDAPEDNTAGCVAGRPSRRTLSPAEAPVPIRSARTCEGFVQVPLPRGRCLGPLTNYARWPTVWNGSRHTRRPFFPDCRSGKILRIRDIWPQPTISPSGTCPPPFLIPRTLSSFSLASTSAFDTPHSPRQLP